MYGTEDENRRAVKSEPQHRETFRSAVRLIDAQRRMLADAGSDESTVDALSAIIRFLHRLPDSQIEKVFGIQRATPSMLMRDKLLRKAGELSLDDVEVRISSEDTSRAELEAIAIGRFHVPKGSMRSMGNIDRLKERIRVFVENERTHSTIAELAKKA